VFQCLRTDEAGVSEVVYTNLITPETLEDLRGLYLCPMIFQAPKALELQVTVVGRRVFTAAVDSQIAAGPHVGWRRGPGSLSGAWRPYALPPEVEEELLPLLAHLGAQLRGDRSHPDPRRVICLPGGQPAGLLRLVRRPTVIAQSHDV